MERSISLPDDYPVTGVDARGIPAIDGEKHWPIVGAFRGNLDLHIIGKNKRALAEAVRTDRCDDHHRGLRSYKRPACGKRISSRASRSRDDKTIGTVPVQPLAVHRRFESNKSPRFTPGECHLIKRVKCFRLAFRPVHGRLQQHAGAGGVTIFRDGICKFIEFRIRAGGEEAESPHVDSRHRFLKMAES